VVRVRWQEHVLREIDFHAMAFTNRDGGRYLHEAIQDSVCRLGDAAGGASRKSLGTTGADRAAALGKAIDAPKISK
jgi:hypothetical protein